MATKEPTEPSKAFLRKRGDCAVWSPQIQKVFDKQQARAASRDAIAEDDYANDMRKRYAKMARAGVNPNLGPGHKWPVGIPFRKQEKGKPRRITSDEARRMGAKGGRIGGSKTSDAKKVAVRANGRLGGRPRKDAPPKPKPTLPPEVLENMRPENVMTPERLEQHIAQQPQSPLGSAALVPVVLCLHNVPLSRCPRVRDGRTCGAQADPAAVQLCACHEVPMARCPRPHTMPGRIAVPETVIADRRSHLATPHNRGNREDAGHSGAIGALRWADRIKS